MRASTLFATVARFRRWPMVVALAGVMVPASIAACAGQSQPSTTTRGAVEPGTALTVATYNILGGRRHGTTLETLRAFEADIIFLQEVVDSPARLGVYARMLGMRYVFAPYTKGSRSGCAVLVHGRIEREEVLTQAGERNYGLCARATVKGRALRLVCVHLKSLPRPLIRGALTSMDERGKQAKAIIERVGGHDAPTIIAGDCNALPFFPEYLALSSAFRDSCVAAGTQHEPTIFVKGSGFRIDHIFTRGPFGVRSCRAPAAGGSDHRPVVAELVLADGGSAWPKPTATTRPARRVDRAARTQPATERDNERR